MRLESARQRRSTLKNQDNKQTRTQPHNKDKKMDKHAGGREGIERFGDGGERMGGWKKRAKGRKKGAPGGRGV